MSCRVISTSGIASLAKRMGLSISLLPAAFLLAPSSSHAESYLDAIQVEAGKLGGGAPAAGESTETEAADAGGPRAEFETELKDRYSGSYLFYKKLPARSQEEVFLEFQSGASIDEVRKTIMNRFLHSR